MSIRETFLAEAAKRILMTDGAWGTQIQNFKLAEADYAGDLGLSHDQKGNNDILALTRPDVVEAITRAYFDAGSDIISTNTFSSNLISQADYGAEHLVRDLNIANARANRKIADEYAAKDSRPRFVAGAIGPTNKTLSLSPDVNDPGYREITFDYLKDVYRDQVDALVDGGPRSANDDLDDADRLVGTQPLWPYRRGLLVCGAPCQTADDRAELLLWGRTTPPACEGALGHRRYFDHGLSKRRPAQ
jgi:methionine synthase I (cobalamin-dependent)